MWQIFSFLAIFAAVLEVIIDKFIVINIPKLDNVVMTFLRVFAYMSMAWLFGFLISGEIHILFHWLLIFPILSGVLNSYLYTRILSNLEATNIRMFSYIGPIFFLCVDAFFLHISLSVGQIIGIVILVLSGFGMSIDWEKRLVKNELSLFILGCVLFGVFHYWIEDYLYKHFYSTTQISWIDFFASIFLGVSIIYFFVILFQKNLSELFSLSAYSFVKGSLISKGLDAVNTYFATKALTLASVSQVSAMDAALPVMLLLVAFITQNIFHKNIWERIDSKNLSAKVFFSCLIGIGVFLIQ